MPQAKPSAAQKTSVSARKTRNIERNAENFTKAVARAHRTRQPLPNPCQYGRPQPKRLAQFVTFAGVVKDQTSEIFPLHVVKCDGKILEISPKQSDAIDAISKISPGLPYAHTLLSPISGKNTLVSSRGFQ